MSRKIGDDSGRFHTNKQSSRVANMMGKFMEDLDLEEGSIRDLEDDPEQIEIIPTQVVALDHHLRGGIPRQSICEVYGESQGGKSWLAQKMMAQVTQKGGRVLLADVEVGFNPFRARDIGVKLDHVTFFGAYKTGEQVLNMVTKVVDDVDWDENYPQPKPYDLIVVDSIAVLPTEDQVIEGRNRIGSRAQMISKWQREILPALSRSGGMWLDEWDDYVLIDDEVVDISTSGFGSELWNALKDAAKKRGKIDAEHLYVEGADEEVGELPDVVRDFEEQIQGKVIELKNGHMIAQKFNPGPVVVVINQVRMTGFNSWKGPSKGVTGGKASLYMASTRINMEPKGGKSGKILDDNGDVEFYISRVKLIKSRYTKQVVEGIEIKIPASETDEDEWDQFLNLLEERELYWYGYGYHNVPKPDKSEGIDAFIKTKDIEEFMEMMLEVGLDFATEELDWSPEQMQSIRESCAAKLAAMRGEDEEQIETDEDGVIKED